MARPMATRTHDIYIGRPSSDVFNAVADLHTHSKWQQGLVRTEHSERDGFGAGTKGAEVRRILGREVRFPYEITVHEPPLRWGFRATSGPVRPSAVLAFETEGSGTRITSTLSIP